MRNSENPEEYGRSAYAWDEDAVWHDVLDCFPEMARWVVHNKSVPHAILDRLIETGDRETRDWITSKRKLTPAQMERLARDPEWRVRVGIADHPKISNDLLARLQRDSNHWVWRRAYQTLAARKAP